MQSISTMTSAEGEQWKARALAAEALLEDRRTRQRVRMRTVRAQKISVRTQEKSVVRAQESGPLLITLGTRYLGNKPRCDFEIAAEQQPPGSGPLVVELITTMNRTLGSIYTDYTPVRGDNRASSAAAIDLESAGVDPAWAAAELRTMCVQFNRGRHGKGSLPGTLAYFRRGLLTAWRRHNAGDQLNLPLVSIEAPKPRLNVPQPRPGVFEEPTVTGPRALPSFDWRALVEKPERKRA